MSLPCMLGRHRPTLTSIAARPDGLVGLCEGCGRTMQRPPGGKWMLTPPLVRPAR